MRALAVEPAGTWDTARKAGHVTLASDARHRRRLTMRADEGFEFLLDLVHATGTLRLAADHVIAEMATGLGATVRAHEAPFDPEPGAYASHAHGS